MVAGGSAARRAQEARRQERLLRQQWQAARERARRWQAASEGEQRVTAQLLMLTERGWRLLVDRRWPGTRAANVDMLLVGPGGVFVADVKNWQAAPAACDGSLRAGGVPRDEHARKLNAVVKAAEGAVSSLGLSPVAVQPLMVFAGQRVNARLGRIRLLGEWEVGPHLLAERHRLPAASVRAIADHLERVFPDYETPAHPADGHTAPRSPDTPTAQTPPLGSASPEPTPEAQPLGLFDLDGMREAALAEARQAPIERWMTFLHPDQVSLVRRNWSGPARISGPAGTGKTVVALHRAAHLAERTAGQVLYVTFANNLPRVQSTFLRTLSPAVVDRVTFRSLHAFAQELLNQRGVPVRLHRDKAETAFSLAWKHVGRDGPLAELDPAPGYWKDEISYVIKGRGLTTYAEYATVPRHRRRVPLRARHREAVWALYEAYEERRLERGVHDFNDILTLALTEARAADASPYTVVVVDEVQDLTLVGVRLLHALVGDAPNGLLLVGDGQQAVYPGGFRLSDAGVDIRGDRGQVLHVNYRNSKEILDAALAVVADDAFDDLDGQRTPGSRDVDLTYHDGQVIRVERPSAADHDAALLDAVRELSPEQRADAAVLCPGRRDIEHYHRLFREADVPVRLLDHYDGSPVSAIKLGSYRRAKGLEFKRVFLPRCGPLPAPGAPGEEPSDADRERRELDRTQLFVAMTRARDTLWLGEVRPEGGDCRQER